ncbi:integrase core domain-containing protein [Carboxylicivirga marina]|uniref:Transposase n=1 Tax=Carboxylicivirga marina TaxID=2800988 RepID=A0ABS1HQK4_9BACT|nr:integrase core domain-containing protein [uncultured Carboxylicivirga sp.]MBK3519963.1 transposase [Carboxylicivirga marina]
MLPNRHGKCQTFKNYTEAKEAAAGVIPIYNEKRPHSSCDYLTPEQAHGEFGELKKRWKPITT